jgi:hypothetical protein
MATVTLVDFEDIYTAICEQLKIQLTDGATVARIKRDVNTVYLNEVIPFKPRAWWWLKKRQDVQTHAKIETGTISTTDGSTTVTFSSAPASSVAGYYLKIEGYEEVIEVDSHTGASTTATLVSAWQRGTLSGQGYTLWKDYLALDEDMKEVTQITHDKMTKPLEMVSNTKFWEKRIRMPEYQGYPVIAMCDDFDEDDNRQIRWFPACDSTIHTLHIEGIQEATRLSSDADEPLMPVEDRICLYYGGLWLAWDRERNESMADKYMKLFLGKLNQMCSKSQDAPKKTEMQVDSDYLVGKRYKRLYRARRSLDWRKD